MAADASAPARSPANRLGLDYRAAPPRKTRCPIVDVHMHLRHGDHARLFFDAADAYGITRVLTMSPTDQAAAIQTAWPGRVSLNAVPRWKDIAVTDEFRNSWMNDLSALRGHGAKLCKFWMAPPMREKHGLTLDHAFMQPVIDHALALGYEFMVHVGDPSVWWRAGAKYAGNAKVGTKEQQYDQLRFFLERVAPRHVIAAHMGGFVEDPDFLQELLDRFPHLMLDTSATKWIVREVARRPLRVRDFVIKNADRILFGSDVVTDDQGDFDLYASRYWAQQMMWETNYCGESPIDDPDADGPPLLAGLDLPESVLWRVYWQNAERLAL